MFVIYNKDLHLVGSVLEVSEFTLTQKKNKVGSFSFNVVYSKGLYQVLRPSYTLYHTKDSNISGVIETVVYNKTAGLLQVSGVTLLAMLDWKPAQTNTWSWRGSEGFEMAMPIVVDGNYAVFNETVTNESQSSSSSFYSFMARRMNILAQMTGKSWWWDHEGPLTIHHSSCTANLQDNSILKCLEDLFRREMKDYWIDILFESSVSATVNQAPRIVLRQGRNFRLNTNDPRISEITITESNKGNVDKVFTEYAGKGYTYSGSYWTPVSIEPRVGNAYQDYANAMESGYVDRVVHVSCRPTCGRYLEDATSISDKQTEFVNVRKEMDSIAWGKYNENKTTVEIVLDPKAQGLDFRMGDIIELYDNEIGLANTYVQVSEIEYVIVGQDISKIYAFEAYDPNY